MDEEIFISHLLMFSTVFACPLTCKPTGWGGWHYGALALPDRFKHPVMHVSYMIWPRWFPFYL